ncbi:MAG: hypothetical protein LBD27_02885 [Tannerella sp.]|nr:hypothetical protein [Tannerella sp.]
MNRMFDVKRKYHATVRRDRKYVSATGLPQKRATDLAGFGDDFVIENSRFVQKSASF